MNQPPIPGLIVRSNVRAGSYYSCQAYCNQEYQRCLADPKIGKNVCDDRLPICQNACDVCATTYP